MKFFCIFLYFIFTFKNIYSSEKPLFVAVASNFLNVFEILSKEFESKYGYKVFISYDSSSNLYSKIINGAFFDVFISADKRHTNFFYKNNIFFYKISFIGKISFFSDLFFIKKNFFIKISKLNKIVFANPKLAPYGNASLDVINNLKICCINNIIANNVSNSYFYIKSKNVDCGFVSLSQNIFHETFYGNYFIIPQYLYADIEQSIYFFNKNNNTCSLNEFLSSEFVINLFYKYGYIMLI